MQLWKITMTKRGRKHLPCTDYAAGYIIGADFPKQVRTVAMKDCGDEGKDIWHDAQFSKVERIGEAIPSLRVHPYLILRDYCGS